MSFRRGQENGHRGKDRATPAKETGTIVSATDPATVAGADDGVVPAMDPQGEVDRLENLTIDEAAPCGMRWNCMCHFFSSFARGLACLGACWCPTLRSSPGGKIPVFANVTLLHDNFAFESNFYEVAVIRYGLFFAFNPQENCFAAAAQHEGDIEQVSVYIRRQKDVQGADWQRYAVYTSAHGSGDAEWRRFPEIDLGITDLDPPLLKIFVARHSHALYQDTGCCNGVCHPRFCFGNDYTRQGEAFPPSRQEYSVLQLADAGAPEWYLHEGRFGHSQKWLGCFSCDGTEALQKRTWWRPQSESTAPQQPWVVNGKEHRPKWWQRFFRCCKSEFDDDFLGPFLDRDEEATTRYQVGQPMPQDEQEVIIRRFAPIFIFDRHETVFPSRIQDFYLQAQTLRRSRGSGDTAAV